MTAPPTSDREYVLSDQIGFLLRLANQRHLELFHKRMPDLTPTQFALMVTLSDSGNASQNELGRRVGIDAATTNGVVERLMKKNFIQSQTDPDDKRRLQISLSDSGRQVLQESIDIAHSITSATLTGLTTREAQRLVQLLKKMQSSGHELTP